MTKLIAKYAESGSNRIGDCIEEHGLWRCEPNLNYKEEEEKYQRLLEEKERIDSLNKIQEDWDITQTEQNRKGREEQEKENRKNEWITEKITAHVGIFKCEQFRYGVCSEAFLSGLKVNVEDAALGPLWSSRSFFITVSGPRHVVENFYERLKKEMEN